MQKPTLGVIASTPRGYTSLLMRMSEKAVGEDRIIGKKFNKLETLRNKQKQFPNETDKQYAIRMYIESGFPQNSEEAVEQYKKMNPYGFYEHDVWSVRGISYSPVFAGDIKRIEEADPDNPLIIKLVCTGLVASDPRYLKWVVYSMRHPWDVAESQKDLVRSMKFQLKDGRIVDLWEGQKFVDPAFYISNVLSLANWRLAHPDIPMLFIDADEFMTDTRKVLKDISDFTGEDYNQCADMIDPKQSKNRGKNREYRPGIWEDAIYLHECLLKQDFKSIVEFSRRNDTWFAKKNASIFCTRLRKPVGYSQCVYCHDPEKNKEFIQNNIKFCEVNNYDWENEPCTFECGLDPADEDPKTIEESIKNNHWVPFKEKFTPSI
jgi:hypothetical protein